MKVLKHQRGGGSSGDRNRRSRAPTPGKRSHVAGQFCVLFLGPEILVPPQSKWILILNHRLRQESSGASVLVLMVNKPLDP